MEDAFPGGSRIGDDSAPGGGQRYGTRPGWTSYGSETRMWVAAPLEEVWASDSWVQPFRRVRAIWAPHLGYYGMTWSLYSALIARGAEVLFDRNAMVDDSLQHTCGAR